MRPDRRPDTPSAVNRRFAENARDFADFHTWHPASFETKYGKYNEKVFDAHINAEDKGALFDARAFILPKEEVCNYFIWRQQDATRNSIQMVAQNEFSQKELHGKNCSVLQDMLMLEKGINWNDCSTVQKRGSCIIKVAAPIDDNGTIRYKWACDEEIPIFTQDRDYIDKLVFKE